ncbi:MAG TPA: twin-arginine translocase TatA/TatE family subunit [Deltaproteobacteria bacterium]|jgi:sec-independent protein translocase protein TatB|nr:twin-arginine translocase TatA/TatE family subunit [Deltaproteobacteria bacterium]HQH99722.1 twin-arginine translocase TatA/TatE family subunit [Deltaproteobacteria bacterium]
MFGIGGQELFFIILLALLLLGPGKLPEIMKTLGKAMGEFQRASNDLKREIDLASQEKPARPAPGPAPAEKTSSTQEDPAERADSPDKETSSSDQPESNPDVMKG